MASAGLAPLLIWLVERSYVDVLVSTSANANEDLLEARGTPFYQVDPDQVDGGELWQRGFYRSTTTWSARKYECTEDFASETLRGRRRRAPMKVRTWTYHRADIEGMDTSPAAGLLGSC